MAVEHRVVLVAIVGVTVIVLGRRLVPPARAMARVAASAWRCLPVELVVAALLDLDHRGRCDGWAAGRGWLGGGRLGGAGSALPRSLRVQEPSLLLGELPLIVPPG